MLRLTFLQQLFIYEGKMIVYILIQLYWGRDQYRSEASGSTDYMNRKI